MKLKPLLLYILFFIAVIPLFIYVLFPQKDAAIFLSNSFGQNNPNFEFFCEKVKVKFPFKLDIENSKFIINKTIEFKPESFEINLIPTLFLHKSKKIVFQSNVNQGLLKGSINLHDDDSLNFSKADLFISDIKIINFKYKTDIADVVLGCIINGEYDYNEDNGIKEGNGNLIISDVTAKMEDSQLNELNLPLIDFSKINIDFYHQDNEINISHFIARGSVINLELNGKIVIFDDNNVKLDLKGVVLQDSPYLAKFSNTAFIKAVADNILKKGIKFTIKGTLKNPKLSI